MYAEAFNRVRVPATSEWRLAENVFYPEDIQEIPANLPPPSTPALLPSRQPSIAQAFLPPPDALIRPKKASNQSQKVKVVEGKEAS